MDYLFISAAEVTSICQTTRQYVTNFVHHQSIQTPSHPNTIIYCSQFIYILPDAKAIANIVIIIGIYSSIRVEVPGMFFQHRLFQGATGSPETARPRQVPPTQQSSRSPAKERASQPNSASDDFSNLPSRRG